MFTLLVAVGVALVVFGAVVLLRYADRPGGTLKWQGAEVSSAGAGLPLVALGVACIVLAVLRRPAAAPTGTSTTTPSSATAVSGAPGAAASAADSGECAAVRSLPAERVDTVEAGMRDVELLGAHERLEPPFGVVLTDGGRPVGTLRLRRYAGGSASADLYKIEALVDAGCRAVREVRNASRGGNPRELVNWDTARLRLGGREYDLRIGGEGNVTVALTAIGAGAGG